MKNYERFLRNRDGGRERTIKSSERLSSEGSNYQKFLKGRETQLEEESDFSRYLKTRQQRNLLEDKRQERESYLDSERDVSLWDAVTSDKTMDDWKQSRAWKKQNQQEIDEAAAQVAAYEQFERDKIFQSEVENMTSADLDKIISDYDRQIGEIKNEGGFWNAVAPGGIKPSEYSENKDKINALQSEQGRYRAVRDEKKSREMTEGLPADVIELLDEYNSIGNVSQANQIASVLAPESSMMYQSDNYESSLRKQEIAKELTEKGYGNYAELAEYRQYVKDVESNRQSEEDFAEFAKEHPVASSAMSIALAPASSIAGTIGTAENVLKDKSSDLGANPYDSWYFLDTYKNKTRETVPETFEDGVVSAKTKRFLYNTGMSAADSALMGVTMGGTGAALLGASAMNDTYVDVLKKGGTDEQALLSGVAAGAAEGFFEKVSLGRFTKTVDAKSVKDIVKNVMVEAGVNASEEAFTEISNIATDYFINGGLSDGYQAYEGYLKQGLSKEQAIKATAKDMGSRVFEAAASGALMGAGFGTYNSARNAVEYNSAMQDIGRNIVENNAVEKELAAASELGVDENDALFKFAKEIEAYQSKKNQNEAYEGTKREMRSLGRLSEGLDVVASDKIKDTSTNAIKDRLSALGEEGNIDDVSSVVLKKATGEKLTKKENHILQKSKYGVRVINELTERGTTSSEWADKVDSNIDDIVKSRNTPDIEAYKSGNTSEKAAETAITTEKDKTPYGFENYEKQVKEKIINEGQDKERFDSDFELFKQYGEAGRSFEEVKSNSTVSKDFTEVQMKSAFDIGVQKAEAKKMTVLKGVKGVDESGEIYVIDSKDQTRKLSEINTDETTRNLYKSAAKYDTAAANVFVQGYNRSASVSSYRTAFNAFYSAGTAGQRSFSEVMKDNNSLVRYMADKAYAEKAFDIGRQERLNADKAVYQKKQTGNFPAKGVYQSKTVSTGAEAVDEFYTAVSKKLGLDIDRVQSIVNRNGQEANAQYDPTKHKMTVSASAQNEWQASVHELTHAAFSYNSAKMKEVKKAIVSYYLKNNSETDLESILEQYKLAYEGDSRADIEEEFIADALGGMFSTQDGVQDFLNWLQNESGYNAEKKKDILQRITEWLSDIIEAIKEIMNDGELNGAGKLFAKQQCDELAKIRKMFLEALDGAGVNYRKKGAVEGDVRNSLKDKKITPDMSEKDRTEVLKNTELNIAKYDGNDELNGASVLKLKSSYNSEASKILKTLGEKFGVFKGYTNNNVELEFEYSRGSLNESVHKQGDISTNFYDFARMLYVFDDVIKNAVPIEIHTDKYKGTMREDRNLKYDYVLFSAFSDGNHIIPVELHIKEYKTTKVPNKLYVSITLGKIKIEDNVKVQTADKNQRNNTQLSSFISLPQLISKINPEYGNFYKYIPRSLLNEPQIKSKAIAEADEDYRLKVMRGEDVSQILKNKALQKGYDTDFSYRMDHRAPNAKYDTCITDIDRAYGGDGSIYSQYAAHYYGDGRTYDYKAINVIKKARSSPESLITIYRAVPTNVKDTRIRNGDWVTIVKDYADEHGWRTLDDDYRIIENKVPAKYLFTDGNSIHEFGYDNGNTNEVYKNTDNNVKVTEVTYDERGQLIPLSKRFDDEKSDIRYSKKINLDKSEELSKLETEKKKYDNEIFTLRRDFDKLKKTDEYERLETAVVEAHGNDEAFNAAIDEYNKWLDKSGMREINRKLTEAKARQSELRKEITRIQTELHKDFMKSIESFDDETVDKYVNKAVRKFKTTSRFNLAGYITTTGSLLDFSDGQGYRVQDHREVKDVLDLPDYAEYSDGMIAFMNMGNIRLQSYGIDISKMPNSKQIAVLRRFFNSLNGEVVVDFSQPDGYSAGSIEYPENTKADRILNDIKKYFDTGVVPELSDVQRFRYSLPLSNLNDLHQSNIEKVTELGRVAAQLTAHINYIGSSQTKRTLGTLNIQAVARQLKKEYQSKADIHELTTLLDELYKLFEQGRVSSDVVKAHIDSITEKIINESVYMKPDISEYAKEILRELRGEKIKLSDVQKQQAAYHFGSYNEFRKALMGSVVLSEEGTPLDERWQSLCGMFPGRFDSETVDTDQPYALFEAIKELRNTYEDESGLDIDSVKAQLSADICAGYISIPTVAQYSNQYSVLEQELLQSLKAEKQMYKQIYSQAYKNAQSEYGLQLKKMRADQAEEILRAKARMNQRVENIADTRLREKKRNRLIKTVKRLDRLLRKPDRAAPSAGTNKYGQEYVHLTNIPEGLKKTVIDFCSIFVDNDAGVFTGKFTDSENVVRKKINELRKQYQNLKSSEAYISTVVSDDMTEKLEKMHEIVADKRLAQLTATELDTLNEIADHLITVINNEVEMWVNGVKTKVDDMGQTALNEQNAKGMKGYIQAMKGIDKINVMNLKPIYFFEKVGGTLEKLWNDILGGQDRYVRNMQYAQQKFSSIAKKHNLDSWIDDDAKTFKTEQGHEISLTRGQALLVWATWKREGIAGKDSKHLFEGGIVFPDAVEKASDKGKNKLPKVIQKVYEDGTAHRIRVEDMLKIDEWLTKEQKAYADELVSFLSNDVAGWGNEISMQLYGINKFNEKYYIPFNSAGNYLYKGMGDEGTKLLKSEGFTKETQWGANNPLVVDDFTQVVVKHIERMSMYNSMVVPLDNFSRVWNYQERADADSNDSTQDVKAAFQTAWGEEYKKYVDNLLRDINGGVMSDSREISDKWISKFKKAAVMGSASVMIQQPSAIVRAFSEVDTKYFVASTFAQRKKAYEEAKKYAPVAVLKEIGGFDTVGGQSMTDWMLKRDYKGKDKLIAFFKDSQFRDDVISWGPAFADRVTWAHIWLACKKEVQHKGYDGKKGLTGEALLEAAGKRFTEVINKTQVYDSVLSRSDAMRSKSTLMKMQTAFMAEPVTQWNMYGSALRDLRTHGARAKGARKIAAVVGAQAFNSILVSMIYAARDDDEEKTLLEKYLGEVVGNFLDSLNPLALVPFFKDIISLLQGYNVERSDMSVFANLVDSITDLWNENLSGNEKAFGFAGSTLDVFGVPFKNFARDGKALVNTARSLSAGQQSTGGGIRASIKDEIFPILKNIGVISDKKGDLLYDAWIKSDKSLYAEYASRYKDGKAVKSALTSQIKDRYLKGSLGEEDVTVQLSRLGYSENDVYYKLREWDAPEQTEETNTEDENEAYLTIDGINSLSSVESDDEGGVSYVYLHNAIAQRDEALIKSEIEDLMNRGAEEKQIKMSVQSKWGRAYRESLDPNERKEIERMIAATGLWQTGEVFDMTRRWRKKAEEDRRNQ